MNGVEFEFRGKKYLLAYNGAAMFDFQDKFGGEDMLERATPTTRDGFMTMCHALEILSAQGNAVSAYERGVSLPTLDAADLQMTMIPIEMADAHSAITAAVLKGYGREIQEEVVDKALAEFKKKAENGESEANT